MTSDPRTNNLAGWLNEPYVKDAVVTTLRKAEHGLLLRDIAQKCELPISSTNRVLCRLHKKGLVTRYKLPMTRHIYCHRRKTCIPWGAQRWLYVYSWDG